MTLTKSMPPPGQTTQPRLSTIVVATDFSDSATAALEWASDLASAHAAKIVLVHAIETESPALAESVGRIDAYVRQKLETASKRLTGAVLAQTEYDRGTPWSVIAAIANDARADLIVVGAHSRSRFRVLGSVADRLIRTTSIPVLVHRDRADDARESARTEARGVRTVLAATDFSDAAGLALETAVGLLAHSTGPTRLVLFHAVPPMNLHDRNISAPSLTYLDDTERVAAAQLQTLADAWRSDRLQVEIKTLRGNSSEAILDQAQAMQADLIALGTVGRSGLNRLFIGSVAQRVLHHAKCPVLVVRKAESGEQRGLSTQDGS